MNRGFIFEWNALNGVGRIKGCSTGARLEYPFEKDSCCPALLPKLTGDIHNPNVCPGERSLRVTFEIDGDGDAISVCSPP